MKKTKIIFFGAMAAIMMSAGAHAAVTQIASTDYVNTLVGTKADTTVVTALGDRVAANETAIQKNAGDISTNTDDISGIKDTIGTIPEGGMTVGGTAVQTIVGAIQALDEKPSVDAYTKDEANKTFATKAELGDLATMDTVGADQIDDNAVTTAKIADGAVTLSKVETNVGNANKVVRFNSAGAAEAALLGSDNIADGAVTTEKIADGNVTKEKLAAGVIDELKPNLTGYATEIWVGDNYIPKPTPDCTAESGTCVLTVDTAGALKWMNVTAPTATAPDMGE